MEKWAKDPWAKPEAISLAQGGQSVCHRRRTFTEFLFASSEEVLACTVQHCVHPSELWNDGPLVWTHMVLHFFPTPKVLRTSLLEKVKNMKPSSFGGNVTEHTRDFRESLLLLETKNDNIELKGALFRELNVSSFAPLAQHFSNKAVNFCLGKHEEDLLSMLTNADKIANLANSDALHFKKSAAAITPEIATLIGTVGTHDESVVKILGCVSKLQNEVKQLRESSKANTKHFAKTP